MERDRAVEAGDLEKVKELDYFDALMEERRIE